MAIFLALAASTVGCKDKKSDLQPVDMALPDDEPEDGETPTDDSQPDQAASARDAGTARQDEPYQPLVDRDSGPPAIVIPEVVE